MDNRMAYAMELFRARERDALAEAERQRRAQTAADAAACRQAAGSAAAVPRLLDALAGLVLVRCPDRGGAL